MSRSHELEPDELDLVCGGSTKLFSSVTTGATPSHNYGLISDSFGSNMSYSQANTLLQQFNAPTRDALYGQGNDPSATFGVISRPGAQNLPGPLDWGGNVTLQHGDGFAVNTTIDFQHPLEGTITRNLVSDFHDGGGYQVLTLGQGQGGAQLATIGGAVVGGGVGALADGPPGAIAGGAGGAVVGQNGAHLVNPELGNIAFSQLDNAMLAHANDTHNPNLDAPGGLTTELGNMGSALFQGARSALGWAPVAQGADVQHQALFELAHDLNSQGPVTGSFALSANNVGIYHFTPEGSKYYEMDNGHLVEKQVDESSGVDAAISHQAALDAQHPPTTTPDGDIHLPDPPAPIIGLPPELTPHDDNGAPGADHTDTHSLDSAPADAHTNGDGAVHVDGAAHANPDPAAPVTADTSHAADAGTHASDPAPTPAAAPPVETPPPPPVETAPPAPVEPPPAPVDIPIIPVDIPPPIFIPPPVEPPPPPITVEPIPVVPPVDPGVDSGPAGGFDGGGGGFDGGSFDGGGFDGGGFDGGGGD